MEKFYIIEDFITKTGGNDTKTYPKQMESIGIANDGTTDVVVTINTPNPLTITVKAGEVWDEPTNPFDTWTSTATGAYRVWVRNDQNKN